jgi:uncharacterized protein (TIGR01568 family)
MPRTTERMMRACFPPVRRPELISSSSQQLSKSAAAAGSTSRPPSLSTPPPPAAFVDDGVIDPSEAESEADTAYFSNAIASRRFFFASPGRSNSIVDSAERAAPPRPSHGGQPATSDNNARALRRAAINAFPATGSMSKHAPRPATTGRLRYEDIHPLPVTSSAPRADFLESMVEMADAMGLDPRRGVGDVAALQELLLIYITVNERGALGDIIGAYADLLRLFGADNGPDDAQRQTAGA